MEQSMTTTKKVSIKLNPTDDVGVFTRESFYEWEETPGHN